MKFLIMTLAILSFSTACSTPKEKYEERQEEAREDYEEELKEAQEEYRENSKDEAKEMIDDSDGVKIDDENIKLED